MTTFGSGTLAVATVRGVPNVRIVRGDGHWAVAADTDDYFTDRTAEQFVTDIRALAVIDPEDRQQVERLIGLFRLASGQGPATLTERWEWALREFAKPTPPKPEEPAGLGAVVEDAEGKRWTRYDERDPQPWWRTSTGDPNEPIECRYAYDDIAAVRVLSEGVTQ